MSGLISGRVRRGGDDLDTFNNNSQSVDKINHQCSRKLEAKF